MHEYLEEQAAHRLTWIVIWLIVAACMVEAVRTLLPSKTMLIVQGEVLARILFHSIPRKAGDFLLVRGGQMLVNGVRTISG
jgi:hypothetical protein